MPIFNFLVNVHEQNVSEWVAGMRRNKQMAGANIKIGEIGNGENVAIFDKFRLDYFSME